MLVAPLLLLAGVEPATFGLEVQCAIHCATGADGLWKKTSAPLRPPGLEPGLWDWKSQILPLNYRRARGSQHPYSSIGGSV